MKKVLKFLGILSIFFVLLLVGLKIYAASKWPSLSDVPPIERPRATKEADPQAWKTLEKILLSIPTENAPKQLNDLYRENYQKEDTALWQSSNVDLDMLKEMRSFSHLELPQPTEANSSEVNLLPMMYLLKLNGIRSWDHIKNEDISAAIETLSDSFHISNLLRRANGNLVSVAVATGSERYGISVLDELLAVQTWESVEDYRAILSILVATDDDYIGTINALKYEALMTDHLLSNLKKESMGNRVPSPVWALGYDADASRAYSLLYWNDLIQEASKPYTERSNDREFGIKIEGFAAYFHNFMGKIALDIAIPEFLGFVKKEEFLVARKRVLIVLCAARLYMWENEGQIPQSITELIPEYLTYAPKDPFGEGPISLQDGMVYSVMHNQKNPIQEYQNTQEDEGSVLMRKIAQPTAMHTQQKQKKKR